MYASRSLSSSRSRLQIGVDDVLLVLEQTWDAVVAEPPSVGNVTKFLVPKLPPPPSSTPASGASTPRSAPRRKTGPRSGRRTYSVQENEELKRRTEAWQGSDRFKKVLQGRMSLPAWKSKDEVLAALDKNRVLVVVGEVKSLSPPLFSSPFLY